MTVLLNSDIFTAADGKALENNLITFSEQDYQVFTCW